MVDLLSKAMHLMLFQEKESVSRKQARELDKRLLSAYQRADKSESADLDAIFECNGKQNGSERASIPALPSGSKLLLY